MSRDPASLERMRLRVAAGAGPGDPDELEPRTARVLSVATSCGAPLLAALDGAAAAQADRDAAARATAVASAQARAVAYGLVVAPLVLVPILGRAIGVDLLAYYTTPLGVATAVVVLGLLLVGFGSVRRLIARVGRPPRAVGARSVLAPALLVGAVAGLLLHLAVAPVVTVAVAARLRRRPPAAPAGLDEAIDLAATAVSGGLSNAAALRAAADQLAGPAAALRRLAFDLELGRDPHRDELPPGLDRLADVLITAEALGAPVGPALRRLATERRADDLARVLADAQRLPAQLTFPTALCLLPAVLLSIGAPIVHAGLSAVDLTP